MKAGDMSQEFEIMDENQVAKDGPSHLYSMWETNNTCKEIQAHFLGKCPQRQIWIHE